MIAGSIVGALTGDVKRVVQNNVLDSAGGQLKACDVDAALVLFDESE